MMDCKEKWEASLPVFKAAIDLIRESARGSEGLSKEQLIGHMDSVADRLELLIDHLELSK